MSLVFGQSGEERGGGRSHPCELFPWRGSSGGSVSGSVGWGGSAQRGCRCFRDVLLRPLVRSLHHRTTAHPACGPSACPTGQTDIKIMFSWCAGVWRRVERMNKCNAGAVHSGELLVALRQMQKTEALLPVSHNSCVLQEVKNAPAHVVFNGGMKCWWLCLFVKFRSDRVQSSGSFRVSGEFYSEGLASPHIPAHPESPAHLSQPQQGKINTFISSHTHTTDAPSFTLCSRRECVCV